jgi:hypothetical protein
VDFLHVVMSFQVIPLHLSMCFLAILVYLLVLSRQAISIKFVRSLQPGISIMFRSLLWFEIAWENSKVITTIQTIAMVKDFA